MATRKIIVPKSIDLTGLAVRGNSEEPPMFAFEQFVCEVCFQRMSTRTFEDTQRAAEIMAAVKGAEEGAAIELSQGAHAALAEALPRQSGELPQQMAHMALPPAMIARMLPFYAAVLGATTS